MPSSSPPRPDPRREIRLVALRSVRGANYWSRWPVARIDMEVGAYDEISSAETPGLTEALQRALPGLVEHRCSVGERGGFLQRLRRGTYAPHMVEHVALELQAMIGHDVAYGRARGGDRPGEYTVVTEHRHAEVGVRALALALELVQDALAGAEPAVAPALAELRALAATPDVPPLDNAVLCAVTGGGDRRGVRAELARRGVADDAAVVDVAPAYLLNAGLPYARSRTAVILDAQPTDVPERYREPDLAARLVAVLADAVPRGGVVVVPAGNAELLDLVRRARCRPALFALRDDVHVEGDAAALAVARGGRLVVRAGEREQDCGALRDGVDHGVQLAAALAWLATRDPDFRMDA